ncbi:MAG TPA: DinB family protein, partial [Acidimicrobiales bacterium]
DIPAAMRALSVQYRDALLDPDVAGLVGMRPEPDVWSALEYACHVRDVWLVQRDRAILALVVDTPSYARMFRDDRTDLAGYQREDVTEVAGEVVMAANLMAKLFEGLDSDQLARPCIYNYPEPTERDVAWLGHHTLHEATHHRDDLHSVLARVALP